MMNCPSCGRTIPVDSAFCPVCGKRIEAIVQKPSNDRPKHKKSNMAIILLTICLLAAILSNCYCLFITIPKLQVQIEESNAQATGLQVEVSELKARNETLTVHFRSFSDRINNALAAYNAREEADGLEVHNNIIYVKKYMTESTLYVNSVPNSNTTISIDDTHIANVTTERVPNFNGGKNEVIMVTIKGLSEGAAIISFQNTKTHESVKTLVVVY